ncbi:MAG: hypothetical protein M3Q06_14060 [Bacteroidota bacterium]|nr:hypothetical protein [Bacteroidota bacterium]
MKSIFLFVIILTLLSCGEATSPYSSQASNTSKTIQDTVVVKHKNDLDKSYAIGFLSKSYSYSWVAGNDTLDFGLIATEHEKDSSLHLHIIHKQPILFSTALMRIDDCLQVIKDDFKIYNLRSLYFEPPIYYADLSNDLSKEYKQAFGQKNIGYQRLNQFLLESNFDSQLNTFLKPYSKTVSRYGIEKFHLLHKENYRHYLKDADLTHYPDFTLHGMGLSIRLTDK